MITDPAWFAWICDRMGEGSRIVIEGIVYQATWVFIAGTFVAQWIVWGTEGPTPPTV